jgi:broad-like protein
VEALSGKKMGTAENFCLRWNEFESSISGAFRELREDSDFFDVTLATSDSGMRSLQAHKVILSACSNFFKQMLRQQSKVHTHPNPLIYLRGVSYKDLLSVLDFIYHGEVNVAQVSLYENPFCLKPFG